MDENNNWLRFKDRTFAKFTNSISNWPNGQVEKASMFIRRDLNRQLERIKSLGLTIETEATTKVLPLDTKNYSKDSLVEKITSNSSASYSNKLYYRFCRKTIKYYKNGNLLSSIEDGFVIYAIVTDTLNNHVTFNEIHNCPNCGSLLTISELMQGCKYCNTKFHLSDIYPVVTNYYTLRGAPDFQTDKEKVEDYLQNFKKSKKISKKISLFIMIILGLNFYMKKSNQFQNDMKFLLFLATIGASILIGLILAKIIEDPISEFLDFKNLFSKGTKSIAANIKRSHNSAPYSTTETKSKLENFMSNYDPNFTYFLFEGKIVSMLKEIIYSNNPENLTIYDSNIKRDFKNVVDSDYRGGMNLNNVYFENGYIYIDLTVFMNDTLYESEKIINKKRNYRVVLCRKSSIKDNGEFRIQNINCKSCGAPIDIDESNKCSYCGCIHDMKEYDFVFKDVYIEN